MGTVWAQIKIKVHASTVKYRRLKVSGKSDYHKNEEA